MAAARAHALAGQLMDALRGEDGEEGTPEATAPGVGQEARDRGQGAATSGGVGGGGEGAAAATAAAGLVWMSATVRKPQYSFLQTTEGRAGPPGTRQKQQQKGRSKALHRGLLPT